ncbi:YcsE-related riboflavin metabolism phosphatase [Mycoplasma sp. 'Moose RK']|uniref:YcsE-related riboflavin metabolism phosphatase n=1 Tax=Mycoplasma sp. 'Moose RK' TaxID=2780095 RepID=UPI0018C32DC7|nr:HAD family hydrolase [Mycoplasma sp. 'Moose RK']MBG0730777.1 HAD family phosphatase [Mycoplasma sp. 'Moose RK']
MNKFKLFATDIDNTIVEHGGEHFPAKIQFLFDKLKAKNVISTFVTGRDFITIGQLFNAKNVDFFIGANGAFIYDFSRKSIIWEKSIQIIDLLQVVEFFDSRKTPYIIMDRNWIYTSNHHPDTLSGFLKSFYKKVKPLSECNFQEKFHIFTVVDNQDSKSFLQSEFEKFILDENLEVSVSSRWSLGFFVVAKNVSKLTTLQVLAKMHQIKNEEIIAFGDSHNDTEMVANVGYGVAMANAIPEVKKVAKDFALTVRQFGVYHKAKELKIID